MFAKCKLSKKKKRRKKKKLSNNSVTETEKLKNKVLAKKK